MYEIAAFVGERKVLENQFPDFHANYIVDLGHAPYALIPITGEVEKAILEKCQISLGDLSFADYPPKLEKIIGHFAKSPQEIKIAFVAAEFFGGSGADFGYVFDNGAAKTFAQENTEWPNSNMSMALKAIGIPENLQEKHDAFDVAGLGKSRSIDGWLKL